MATPNPSAFLWESQFAREVQDRILPSTRPFIPNLDYYGDSRRTHRLNGDYLDYFEVNTDLCLAIGDVEGNGLHSALLTASLHSIVRALRSAWSGSLANFVISVDGLFRQVCPEDCHTSLFVARYDPVSGNLHYVNAGHEPPFVLRHTGRRSRTIRLESGGPVLGLARRPSYRERVLPLNPGDLFVTYTDGVCEAASPQGEEWGWRRFLEAIQSGERMRVRDTVERVWEAVDRFTAGAAPFDDMTLWMARVDEADYRPLPRRAESLELVAA